MQNDGGAAVLQVGEEPDAAFGAGAASVGGSRPGSRKAAAPRQQGRKQVWFAYQVIVLLEVTCRRLVKVAPKWLIPSCCSNTDLCSPAPVVNLRSLQAC